MSDLRSVSPLHLQYLQGFGVAATMTISLLSEDRLWGMVMCHHKTPRRVPHAVRAVCETLARMLSLQLDVTRFRIGRERAIREAQLIHESVTALGEAESLADIVAAAATSLQGIVGADGVLVRLDGLAVGSGGLVSDAETDAFVAWLAELAAAAGGGPWSTDCLVELTAPPGQPELTAPPGQPELTAPPGQPDLAAPPGDRGRAGALVLPLAGATGDVMVWLRQETVDVVSWAGATPDDDPAAGLAVTAAGAALAHRTRSFVPRQEVIRGHSRPWTDSEMAAAQSLGHALPEALLRRARRLLVEREAGSVLERAASTETRQRLERDLQRKLRLESLGKLAGGVAHDFNNLLSVILSHAEFVDDEVQAAERSVGGSRWAPVARDTEQIISATQRAAQLTRELLSFARREVTQPRVLDLNQVIRDLELLLRRVLGPHIVLRFVLTTEPVSVVADPEQLERLLVNLAVNSRDAMSAGGRLTVTTDTLIIAQGDVLDGLASTAGRHVRMRVDDTGHGIPREVLDRVFDPFFTTKGDGEGSGLGLATVHGIVDQAGGKVTIYSEPGNGTSISILLPATDPVATRASEPGPLPPVTGQTVLLVEDEPAIRGVTRRILERSGYQVLVAASGAERSRWPAATTARSTSC